MQHQKGLVSKNTTTKQAFENTHLLSL